MKKFLLLGILVFGLAKGFSQFSFTYDGPEYLYTNDNCLATLDWGAPATPQAFPTQSGQVVTSFEVFSISGGYSIGDPIPPNQVVTVFYQAMDNFGQSALYGFNLFTIDTFPPTFDVSTLPADVTVECNESVPIPFIEYDDNCASDTTVTDLLFSEEGSASACDGGIITRTWTVIDESSNTVEYVQTITVLPDTVPPIFVEQPVNGTAECGNAMTAYSAWLTQQRNTVELADNGCGVLELTDNAPPPSVLTMFCGEIVVDFTATDSCGNTSVLSASFNVTNDVPPTITEEAQDISIDCGSGNPQQEFQNWLDSHGGADGFDDCSFLSWSTFPEDPVLGDTCGGSSTILFIADDGCGNTDTTQATVTVIDTVGPAIIQGAQNRVINCSSVDVMEELGNWINGRGLVNVADLCTDSADIQFAMTINGMVVDSAMVQEALQNDLDTGCLDNIIIDGLLWNNVLARLDVGFSFTDKCGNSTVSMGTFAVTDNVPPVFDTLPRDTAASCDGGSLLMQFTAWYQSGGFASATDDCSPVSFTGSPGMDSAFAMLSAALDTACGSGAMVTVEFNASDVCGNLTTDSHAASFSIIDTLFPEFDMLPADAEFSCSSSIQEGINQWLDTLGGAMATDDCGDVAWMFSWVSSIGDTLTGIPDFGPYPDVSEIGCSSQLTVTFLASDQCGNTTAETAAFTAIDTIVPELILPLIDQPVSCDSLASLAMATATDNCDQMPFVTFTDSFEGAGCSLQLHRTWSARDVCGNLTSATQVIEISDFSPPDIIVPPQDTVIVCEDLASAEQVFNVWVSSGAGIVIEDACSATEYFMALPGTYTIGDTSTYPGAPPVFPSEDSCDMGEYFIDITAQVVYYDACGNSDFSAVRFSVIDTTPPVFDNCPDSISSFINTATCTAMFEVPVPGVSDACAGNNIALSYKFGADSEFPLSGDTLILELTAGSSNLTFYARDCSSNLDSCRVLLVAVDTIFPGISCPGDINVVANEAPCTVEIMLPAPLVSLDNCEQGDSMGVDIFYSAIGSTVIEETGYPQGQDSVATDFNVGTSTVFYIIEDASGNRDSCTFNVTVADTISPTAVCQDLTVYVNPSGLDVLTLDAAEIDNGSFDNCTISEMEIFPSEFPCDSAGTVQIVQLRVEDAAGNADTCTANVTIEMLPLMPGFTIGLCTGDTLQLYANAPDGTFTFQWTGPDNFSSDLENPIILNPGTDNAGVYELIITGTTGCSLTGSVEVAIEEFNAPAVTAPDTACAGAEIILEATSYGQEVSYNWFLGIPPGGELIGTSDTSVFTFIPQDSGAYAFYVVADAVECTSNPSEPVSVTILQTPEATVIDSLIEICEGDSIQLGTMVAGPGISYLWSGPEGFTSNQQFPTPILNAGPQNSGSYSLVVSFSGCDSDPAFVQVEVSEIPGQPVISGDTLTCAGASIELVALNTPGADAYIWTGPDGVPMSPVGSNVLSLIDIGPEEAGEWTVIAINNGCKSPESLPFVVDVESFSVGAMNSGPVCEGESVVVSAIDIPDVQYTWSGPSGFESQDASNSILAIPGWYVVEATSETGCTILDSTEVVVDLIPNITAISSTAGACVSGTEGVTFQLSVFPADDGSYNYAWFGPMGFESDSTTPFIPDFSSANNGEYGVVITNGTCISDTSIILIDVTDSPSQPVLDGPLSVCQGDTIELSTTEYPGDSVVYIWTTPLGFDTTLNIPSLVIPGVQVSSTGSYTVEILINGCSSPASEALDIQVQSDLNGPTVTIPGLVCAGDSVVLCADAPPGALFAWSGPEGFTSDEQCPVISDVSALNEGTYTITYNLGSCVSPPTEIELLVNPVPEVPVLEEFTGSICLGNPGTITLCVDPASATPGATFTWVNATTGDTLAESGMSLCTDLSDFDSFSDGANPVVVLSDLGGCPSELSEPLEITAYEIPEIVPDAGPDQTICPGEVAVMEASSPQTGTGQWDSPDPELIISDPSSAGTMVSGLQEGENIIVWTLSYESCTNYASDTAIIYVLSPPLATDDSVFVDFGEPVQFNVLDNDIATPPFTLIRVTNTEKGNLLEPGNGEFLYSPDIGYVGQDFFMYELCSDICPDECTEAIVTLQVGDENDCFVPSVFTPNNDGINDILIVPCLETDRYPDSKIVVFNQWGGEVYRAQPYKNDWDGKFKGKDLPVSTYYYILDFGDGSPVRKGFLIIER